MDVLQAAGVIHISRVHRTPAETARIFVDHNHCEVERAVNYAVKFGKLEKDEWVGDFLSAHHELVSS